ncbi:MAG: hypothetical protein LPK26_06985 [Bacillaceae bacterium]|nr:hypothetical protein [Bacillaceae bacterium]
MDRQSKNQSHNQEDNHLPNEHHSSPQKEKNGKPWYNQGWLWLLVALLGIGGLFFGFSSLIDEIGTTNQVIQEQTKTINDQNNVLHSINEGIHELTVTIKDAISTIKDSINGSA